MKGKPYIIPEDFFNIDINWYQGGLIKSAISEPSDEYKILTHFIKVNKYESKYSLDDLFVSAEKIEGESFWEHTYGGMELYIYAV